MTSQRSFKSRVRARMDKTGESYTTARRHLLNKSEPAAAPPAATAEIRPQRFSEASLRERTGRGWDEWFTLLDTWGATVRKHGEIARWLVTEHAVDGWWSQSITVAYEQSRGMRAPGQEPDGTFSANASRTVAVGPERLFEAFADDSTRAQWLPDVKVRVRTATAPKSYRADWAGGPSRIVVGFESKGTAKTQVAVQHVKLADAAEAAQLKAYWRERLAALKALLES